MSGGPTTTTKTNDLSQQLGTSNVNTTGNTSLNTTTGPWGPAAGNLTKVLKAAKGIPLNSTPTPQEAAASSGLLNATGAAAGYNPQVASDAASFLGGGGVGANNGYITSALDKGNAALSPYLGTSFLDPMTNPYLSPALTGLQDQITNANKDAFAASGRFGASGDFSKANALGLSQGLAPLLLNQFNTNAGLQQGAINSLANNNISGAGALDTSAMNRANVMQAGPGMLANLYGPYTTALEAANQQVAQPWMNLGYASQFLTPLAQLGGTSSQTGTSSGTSSGTTSQLGRSSGTQVQSVASNPLQTALGGGLGLLGLLSMGSTGGLGGVLGSQLGKIL